MKSYIKRLQKAKMPYETKRNTTISSGYIIKMKWNKLNWNWTEHNITEHDPKNGLIELELDRIYELRLEQIQYNNMKGADPNTQTKWSWCKARKLGDHPRMSCIGHWSLSWRGMVLLWWEMIAIINLWWHRWGRGLGRLILQSLVALSRATPLSQVPVGSSGGVWSALETLVWGKSMSGLVLVACC